MFNEPIFQKLAREYAMRGKSYERMTAPYLSPVIPLRDAKKSLMDTPVYGPNEHLDGPYKAPVNVGENLNGDMVGIVRGTLISEESGWIAKPSDEQMASDTRPSEFEKETLAYFAGKHGDPDVVRAKRGYTPEQTDESVNAASNEENDEDDESVILAPSFWKIRDEE